MDLNQIVSSLRSSGAVGQLADSNGLSHDEAHGAILGLLEHLSGGAAPESAAESVAAREGISPDKVQALLPQVLSLLQGHAASGAAPEGLGGLLGQLGGPGGLGGLFGR